MKFIIASDIHGDEAGCRAVLDAAQREGADKILLLGDILYHGPRNPLPDGYAPQKVFEMLNAVKNKISAVRGNCDSEVDQMVLEFPIMADYIQLLTSARTLFATHGHLFNAQTPPLLRAGELLLNGHFHTPEYALLQTGAHYANCGSVALPKDGTPHSCMVLEDDTLVWKNLENGENFKEIRLQR